MAHSRFPSMPTRHLIQSGTTLLIVYICFFHGLAVFGLVGPDEPRYAAIARDMAGGNDWITPRLHGEPWLEKPVLYYWLAGLGYQIVGDTEAAARLPSACGALVTLLALGWIARRFYGHSTASLFGVMFPSSIAILTFARAATPDMLFASTLAVALTAAIPIVMQSPLRPRHRVAAQAIFGAAVGLAVLAKGPAGVVLAGMSSVVGAALAQRVSYVWRLASPWSLACFGLVALPWYVLCAVENPEFIRVFLVGHNVERFLTPVFRHTQPWWFFIPVMILGIAPWTVTLLAGVYPALVTQTRPETNHAPSLFLLGWVLFPVVFFSLSESKLPGYVLPAIPPTVLLLSRLVAEARSNPVLCRRLGLATAGALFAMAVTFAIAPGVESSGVGPGTVRPLAVTLGAAALVTLRLAVRGQLQVGVLVSALGIALALLQLNQSVLPTLDPTISTRTAAKKATQFANEDPVYAYALHRAWHHGLEYYRGDAVPEWTPALHDSAIVMTTPRGLREMERDGAIAEVLIKLSDKAVLVRSTPPKRDRRSAAGSIDSSRFRSGQ